MSSLERRITELRERPPEANDQPVSVGTGLLRDLLAEIARLHGCLPPKDALVQTPLDGIVPRLGAEDAAAALETERAARLAAEAALTGVPPCHWCGWSTGPHDGQKCLRDGRDSLETHFHAAVDALAPYLQRGGTYAHLMSPGENITTVGPARLVDHLEAHIRALTEALRELDRTNSHRGSGPHCTCSQRERGQIIAAALTPPLAPKP